MRARRPFPLLIAALIAATLASSARAAGPLPRDVVVTDVTPSGFTVTWNAEPGTGTVSVYRDVLGTLPASAVVSPELALGGDPAVLDAAAAVGVVRARVGGLAPDRAYFFRTATTPLGGGAPALVPAPGAALPSVVTAHEAFARTANGLGAPVVRAAGGALVPGALLRVQVAGTLAPLAAFAGDGYPAALAAVDLANVYGLDGISTPIVGGESVVVEAIGGTAGRARMVTTLAPNPGLGTLQQLGALAVAVPADADGDDLPDDWEVEHGLDPGNPADAASDQDGDGLPALDEYRQGTDPGVADTDGDGLSDGTEANQHATIPTIADTDRDGLADGVEVAGPGATDPLDADSDDDGVDDGTEIGAGTDPNDPGDFPVLDADGDGVTDANDRCPTVPDPAQIDTDGDGAGDACDPDDDGDGEPDGIDVCPLAVDPAQADGDDDGVGDVCDNCPALANADQANHDTDADGDACDLDSDNDGVPDFGPAPPASNQPFILTSVTAVVDSSVPPVPSAQAFIGIAKRLPADLRLVPLGFFDLLNRTFVSVPVAPADASAPGWLAVQADTNGCDCFALTGTETITLATDTGNVIVHLPAGAEQLGRAVFVATDGSTYNATNVGGGVLSMLLRSSQVPGPLDNCRFVPNADQSDADGDGIGDACDPSTVTTTTSSVTTTTRVRPSTTTTTLPPGKSLFLFVANSLFDNSTDPNLEQTLMRYDAVTGTPLGVNGNTSSAILVPFRRPGSRAGFITQIAAGPRNGIYGLPSGDLFRWDASTGANLGVNGNPLNAKIPLDSPPSPANAVQLGPDGFLWAMSITSSLGIYRVHPETGAFVNTFVEFPTGQGGPGLSAFNVTPDGLVYLVRGNDVLRYDAATGEPLPAAGQTGALFATGSFQLPMYLAVGPEGDLYVSDYLQNAVFAFDGTTGAARGQFVSSDQQQNGGLRGPRGLAFGPDGNLYVAGQLTGAVLRYDGFTGEFIDTFVAKGEGGLVAPTDVAFVVADTPELPTTTTSTTATTTSTLVTTTTSSSTTTTTIPLCGNGVVDGGEECDGLAGSCDAGSACGAPGTAGACVCVASAAHVFVVNSPLAAADAAPGDGVCETAAGNGVCTLAGAVQETNALAGPDLIQLPAGRYFVPVGDFLTPGMFITDDLTITGASALEAIVDGGDATRIFTISAGTKVTMRQLALTRGRSVGSAADNAGAVLNRGTLTLADALLRDNRTLNPGTGGGGVTNSAGGTVTVVRTEFMRNRERDAQGAAGLCNDGTATVVDSIFRYNVGAAVTNRTTGATLTLRRSAIVRNRGDIQNHSDPGLRVFENTTATVIDSTISENLGVGILATGHVAVIGSTIFASPNHIKSRTGGNAGIVVDRSVGSLTLRNSIVAGSEAFGGFGDCFGTIVSEGYNLIERLGFCTITGDLTGNIIGQAPLLGPLAQQGGLTPTHALLPGSPARNAGNPAAPGSGGTACEAADQRGIARPQSGRCDIGAFEDDGAPPPPPLGTADYVVDDTGTARDAIPGDGLCATDGGACTLGAAIDEAGAHWNPAVIHLPAETFTFTAGPYDDPYEAASALPHVTGDVTFMGTDDTVLRLALPPNQAFRLFLAYAGRVAFGKVTFEGGGPAFLYGLSVRAIGANLELTDVTVRDVRGNSSTYGAVSVHGGDALLRRVSLLRSYVAAAALVVDGAVDIEDLDCEGNQGLGGLEGACLALSAVGPSRIARSAFRCNLGQIGAAVLFRDGGTFVDASGEVVPSLLVEDSTFEGNLAPLGSGAAIYAPDGRASLDVQRSSFIGNQSDTEGSLLVGGPLLVTDSAFTGNSRTGLAGNYGGGAVTIAYQPAFRRFVNTTFTCNQTNGDGGAVYVSEGLPGGIEFENCTFAGNVAYGGSGGALALTSNAGGRVTNSTFVDNRASTDGGAILVRHSTLDLANVTITRNAAGGTGGGIAVPDSFGHSLRNTIIAGNTAGAGTGADCTYALSLGHNLIGTADGCQVFNGVDGEPVAPGDLLGPVDGLPIDPRIPPLADLTCRTTPIGACTVAPVGPAPENVCALAPDSPAVDAGEPGGCTDFDGAPLPADQRGRIREDGDDDGQVRCDIGACEGTDGVFPPTTTTTSTTTTTYPFFPGDPLPEGGTDTTTTLPPTTTTTSSSTSSTAPVTTTTSTLPSGAEICGNCLDDDDDGLADFEDPECCGGTESLTLKKGRLRPAGSRTKLSLKGSLGQLDLGTFPPATYDVFVQVRAESGGDMLCAHIPAANLAAKKKSLRFKDKIAAVASARGLSQLKLRVRKDGSVAVATRGKQVLFQTPSAGRVHVTMGFRNPATADAGNQCRGSVETFRAIGKKGALKFP